MKLSVKPRFGMTHVRGGQVLRVTHDHQVSTKGYDKRPDDVLGKARAFDAGWVTASTGDLAVEVIATKTERVLGYAYLSGPAINVVRYVSDADRALVAGWFTPARGIRGTSPTHEMSVSDFGDWMREMKHADADVVATIFGCPKGRMADTMRALARVYSRAPALNDRKSPTADLIGRVQGDGDREFGVIHFQAPARAQNHACQPFPCDLLLSSPALQPRNLLLK
jgi:hypothetical protein